MRISANFQFEFETNRCFECGTYWAIEVGRGFAGNTCPVCAEKQIKSANYRADTLERSNRAMRGILKRNRK